MDADFDWNPRTEAVTILGGHAGGLPRRAQDAAAASSIATSGQQIMELTWRKDYQSGDSSCLSIQPVPMTTRLHARQ